MQDSFVQKEVAVMKDEIKNLQMGSGSTVGCETSAIVGPGSGTFARPQTPSSRWNDTFIPRKMKFKVWVTDYSKSSLQGITDDELKKFLDDLRRMVPQQAQQWSDWDQTKKEQGTWPRELMVSTCFKHETNSVPMIDLLKITKAELDKTASYINGQQPSEEAIGRGAGGMGPK